MDSIFIIAARNDLPQPTSIAKQMQSYLPDADLDTDWEWGSVEGWLPVAVGDNEAGFELIVDTIEPDSNKDFAVAGRPELDTLIELTPRGGLLCSAAAIAFAAAFAELTSAVVDFGEDEPMEDEPLREYARSAIADFLAAHKKETIAGEALEAARTSGKSDRELLRKGLADLVGQKIIFRGGNLMVRFEDGSLVIGPRCEIRKDGKTVVEHGRVSRLRDQQTTLAREHLADDPDHVLNQFERLNIEIKKAEEYDEESAREAFALMKEWIGNVRVKEGQLGDDNSVELSLSDGHIIRFTTADTFSTITFHTPIFKFSIDGSTICSST